jgi:hypothetical protein
MDVRGDVRGVPDLEKESWAGSWDRGGKERMSGAKTGFMVKLPLPLQVPIPPVTDHLPVICPPLTVPFKVRILGSAASDLMTYWKVPDTWPLKFPLIVNEPLSVVAGNEQGVLFTVRLKLVVPRDPSAFTVNVVWKAKVLAVAFESVADQMPLILPVACEFAPQPEKIRIMAISTTSTAVIFFMGEYSCAGSDSAGLGSGN